MEKVMVRLPSCLLCLFIQDLNHVKSISLVNMITISKQEHQS